MLDALPRHDELVAVLDTIIDPCSLASGTPMGLAEMGLIDTLELSDSGEATVRLRLTSPFCHMIGFFKVETEKRLMALPGVTSVAFSADNGLDWSPDMISPAAQNRRAGRIEAAGNPI